MVDFAALRAASKLRAATPVEGENDSLDATNKVPPLGSASPSSPEYGNKIGRRSEIDIVEDLLSDSDSLTDWEENFLKSLKAYLKGGVGRQLSVKQSTVLIRLAGL